MAAWISPHFINSPNDNTESSVDTNSTPPG